MPPASVSPKDMTTSIKIKKFVKSPVGYEVYAGPNHVLYSILGDQKQMVGPLLYCKSYITSRMFGLINEKFTGEATYNPVWGTIDFQSTPLIVARNNVDVKTFEQEVRLAVDLINKLEKALGLIPTKYYFVDDMPHPYEACFVLVGSKRWLLSPPMFNLYALLARSGSFHNKTGSYMDIADKIPQAGVMMKHIVKNKYWKVFGKDMKENWPLGVGSGVLGEIGVASFSNAKTQEQMTFFKKWFPHWKLPPVEPVSKAA